MVEEAVEAVAVDVAVEGVKEGGGAVVVGCGLCLVVDDDMDIVAAAVGETEMPTVTSMVMCRGHHCCGLPCCSYCCRRRGNYC